MEFAINIEEYKSAISNFFNEKLNCPPLNNVAYHAKLEDRMWKKKWDKIFAQLFLDGKMNILFTRLSTYLRIYI